MDEKVKEIEERLKCCIVTDSDGKQETFLISKEDIKYLLSHIKELEEGFNNQVEMRNKLTIIKFELEARVKELEEGIDFNSSVMAREIFNDFMNEKESHSPNSFIHEIKNDLWIYQVVCAVHLKLYKLVEEKK